MVVYLKKCMSRTVDPHRLSSYLHVIRSSNNPLIDITQCVCFLWSDLQTTFCEAVDCTQCVFPVLVCPVALLWLLSFSLDILALRNQLHSSHLASLVAFLPLTFKPTKPVHTSIILPLLFFVSNILSFSRLILIFPNKNITMSGCLFIFVNWLHVVPEILLYSMEKKTLPFSSQYFDNIATANCLKLIYRSMQKPLCIKKILLS